ncbi:hypothetical protein [Novilysobacter arseniciresistens]|uniref:hypothetical protein n=1 Tax=Novilysobacter arseniciresistens TaxID=1385522 RepID=UPI000AAB4907|nr:hypothetical protein [Lysobacter arseniciresistens]
MSEKHRLAMQRRELERLLSGYGLPKSLRVAVVAELAPDALARLLRQLKPRNFWRLGRE